MLHLLCFAALFVQQSSSAAQELGPAQIFEQAAKAHLGGKSEVQIEDFKLFFDLTVQDQKNHIQFRATHFFKKNDRVKTELDDPDYKVKILTGFSGRYWLNDQDRGTVLLSGKEHAKDIREIEERIRLSQILAKTFSVKRFMEDLKDPKRLPDAVTAEGKRIAVQAKASDFVLVKTSGIQQNVDLILYFDPESFLLREIFATPPQPTKDPSSTANTLEEISEKFVLSNHIKVKDVSIPGVVKIFTGKERKNPAYEIVIGSFDFNIGLKEEDFQPPVKKD